MSRVKRIIGRKAAKTAAKHTVHGIEAKAARKPLRSAGLLGAGMAIGLGAGFAAGRRL